MSFCPRFVPSVVAVAALFGCTFEQMLEAPADASSSATGTDASVADTQAPKADGGTTSTVSSCGGEVRGSAQNTSLDTELIVAWERLDGAFFVSPANVAFTADRRAFVLDPGTAPPPEEARISSTTPIAIGRVYAVPRGTGFVGAIAPATFRAKIAAGTYRDALVWSRDAMTGPPDGPWSTRLPKGFSAWRCSSVAKKAYAFVESTCDGFVLESAGDPNGDRHCDWH